MAPAGEKLDRLGFDQPVAQRIANEFRRFSDIELAHQARSMRFDRL